MENTTLRIGNTNTAPVVQDQNVSSIILPGQPQSTLVRVGVPVLAIIGVVIVFTLAYLAAFRLPDTTLFKHVSRLLNCERGPDEPEDRQTFLKNRRNSLVKRLKNYRASAKKHPRTEEESEPEDTTEYATPYPEELPSNASQRATTTPPPRRYYNTPAAAAAAAFMADQGKTRETEPERDFRRPRPVAYVRPVRPAIENDLFVIKMPSSDNVNKTVIADVHRSGFEIEKSDNKILTGIPDLAGLSASNTYINKAYLSRDSGLDETSFASSQPARTSTPRSPLIEGLYVDKTKAYYSKSLSMQNLNLGNLGFNGARPKGSSYTKLNTQVHENTAYERETEPKARRAQSVANITLTGPLAASQDICV